jgi:hypothetical protein
LDTEIDLRVQDNDSCCKCRYYAECDPRVRGATHFDDSLFAKCGRFATRQFGDVKTGPDRFRYFYGSVDYRFSAALTPLIWLLDQPGARLFLRRKAKPGTQSGERWMFAPLLAGSVDRRGPGPAITGSANDGVPSWRRRWDLKVDAVDHVAS